MAVISIDKKLHNKFKKACSDQGIKMGYAAEKAIEFFLADASIFFDKGGSTQAAHKTASK